MAKTLLGTGGFVIADGATGYASVVQGVSEGSTTESETQVRYRSGGTFSNMSVLIAVNGSSGNDTINLREDGSSVNQTIAITGTATGNFEDTTNTDTATVGNDYSYQIINGSGGTLEAYPFIIFDATTNTVAVYGGSPSSGLAAADLTRFFALEADANNITEATEADAQTKIKAAGTWKNLGIFASSVRSSATTFAVRIGGSDGNQSVSVTGTGYTEDTSSTDTLNADDLINLRITTITGTGNCSPEVQKTEIEYTTTPFNLPSGMPTSLQESIAFNVTTYFTPFTITFPNTTEALQECEIPLNTFVKNLQAHAITNSIATSATTINTRKNRTDGDNSLSISAAATGYFEDTSNTDSYNDEDDMDYQIITPDTSGSIELGMISVTMEESIPIFKMINSNENITDGINLGLRKTVSGRIIK